MLHQRSDLAGLGFRQSAWRFLQDPKRYRETWHRLDADRQPLLPEATKRQMRTAEKILDRFRKQFGVLLSDDVGLGKTLVAVLIAGVFAGKGKRVRILAPNEYMRRKWEGDAKDHFAVLSTCKHLNIDPNAVKSGAVEKLHAGRVQVATHGRASKQKHLACDLLIVDEAHRARGEHTMFRKELKRQRKKYGRVLFLTATPFSIRADDLVSWLRFVGAPEEDRRKVRSFARLLTKFWSEGKERVPTRWLRDWRRVFPERHKAAIEALRRWVIRHSVENLPNEKEYFGEQENWEIRCPPADKKTLEVLLRSDRMLRLAHREGVAGKCQTNDPRFHVGWHLLRDESRKVSEALQSNEGGLEVPPHRQAAITHNISGIHARLDEIGEHPKVAAVADEIARVVEDGEKVLVFCYYHATAVEIGLALHNRLPSLPQAERDVRALWWCAWREVLVKLFADKHIVDDWEKPLNIFADWLSSPDICAKITSWIGCIPNDVESLADAIKKARVPKHPDQTVADAGKRLFAALGPAGSRSTQALLRYAADSSNRGHTFPAQQRSGKGRRAAESRMGGLPRTRVLALISRGETIGQRTSVALPFLWQRQLDTPMAIFNSPFGPDVLVATDRLSEGVDLHRYCRHVVHYELSPSPIRVVQRNGRLRRLGSWAWVTRQPIRVAYPQFRGTRDERLVAIMQGRLKCFDMLLGGAGGDVDTALDEDEQWKHEMLEEIREELKVNASLAVR